MRDYKIEWSLSLLHKYSKIILESDLHDLGLTKTHMLFIIHLKHRPGVHQDYLAEMFKMNRSTVTRGIDHLISLSFVEKKVDEANKKANKLYLSHAGHALYKDMMAALIRWTDILTTDMSEKEKDLAIDLLVKMAGNACKHVGDEHLSKLIGGK